MRTLPTTVSLTRQPPRASSAAEPDQNEAARAYFDDTLRKLVRTYQREGFSARGVTLMQAQVEQMSADLAAVTPGRGTQEVPTDHHEGEGEPQG